MTIEEFKQLLLEKIKKSKMIEMKDKLTLKLKKKGEENYEEQKDDVQE